MPQATCVFIGGPWDGRQHHYSILGVEMFVPDIPGCASMMLLNEQIIRRLHRQRVHVYKRVTLQPQGDGVFAKYHYQGVR